MRLLYKIGVIILETGARIMKFSSLRMAGEQKNYFRWLPGKIKKGVKMGIGYDTMTIICDICKEKQMIKTIKIKNEWFGVCSECDKLKEVKNDNDQK